MFSIVTGGRTKPTFVTAAGRSPEGTRRRELGKTGVATTVNARGESPPFGVNVARALSAPKRRTSGSAEKKVRSLAVRKSVGFTPSAFPHGMIC